MSLQHLQEFLPNSTKLNESTLPSNFLRDKGCSKWYEHVFCKDPFGSIKIKMLNKHDSVKVKREKRNGAKRCKMNEFGKTKK
jgi:hypothetical protein